jgi:hypothetical protein
LELDLFLPELSLGFEYQGEHHYSDIFNVGNKWERQQRDSEKREICKEYGIAIVEIPFWWDMKLPSLVATISQHRSGLLLPFERGEPIIVKSLTKSENYMDLN